MGRFERWNSESVNLVSGDPNMDAQDDRLQCTDLRGDRTFANTRLGVQQIRAIKQEETKRQPKHRHMLSKIRGGGRRRRARKPENWEKVRFRRV